MGEANPRVAPMTDRSPKGSDARRELQPLRRARRAQIACTWAVFGAIRSRNDVHVRSAGGANISLESSR
jgi:hypothetical protein